jgi:agmatinase
MPRYRPVDALQSPRFAGIRTFGRLPHVTDLADVDVAFVGVPFDTGATYRVGCRFGPAAIREASALLRTYNPSLGVSVYDHVSAVDYGDVPVAPGFIEDSYERIVAGLAPVLDAGVVPIALGGDHAISLACLRAVAGKHGPVALVHFDSHSDLWDQYWGHRYTHGTPFRRALEEGLLDPSRSSQVGLRGSLYGPEDVSMGTDLGFQVFPMDEVRRLGFPSVLAAVRERVGDGLAYLTFDVDFIDPAYAPGTGTPEVGGPTTAEALQCVRAMAGVPFVAFDVVEVLPTYDGPGQITALAAANVAFEMLSLVALERKSRGTLNVKRKA